MGQILTTLPDLKTTDTEVLKHYQTLKKDFTKYFQCVSVAKQLFTDGQIPSGLQSFLSAHGSAGFVEYIQKKVDGMINLMKRIVKESSDHGLKRLLLNII